MTIRKYLGKIRFRAYNFIFSLFAKKFTIDYEMLNKKMQEFDSQKLFNEMEKTINNIVGSFHKGEKTDYFGNLKCYDNRQKDLTNNQFPLFPPNVAAMDFILKTQNNSVTVIDYGCGLNNLAVILDKLGFHSIYGYDNYAQIRKETIESFLHKFNLVHILKTKEEILNTSANIAICISYYWEKLDAEMICKEISDPNLRYIMLDVRYTPPFRIKNFKIYGLYGGLLVIYKRA